MILVAQGRSLVLLLGLLMLLGGPAMAMADLPVDEAASHSVMDGFNADPGDHGDSRQECGGDHCCAGLFPRFPILGESPGFLAHRGPLDLLPPSRRYLFRPPKVFSFTQTV